MLITDTSQQDRYTPGSSSQHTPHTAGTDCHAAKDSQGLDSLSATGEAAYGTSPEMGCPSTAIRTGQHLRTAFAEQVTRGRCCSSHSIPAPKGQESSFPKMIKVRLRPLIRGGRHAPASLTGVKAWMEGPRASTPEPGDPSPFVHHPSSS